MRIVIDSQQVFDHVDALRERVDEAGHKLLDKLKFDVQVIECGATGDHMRLAKLQNEWAAAHQAHPEDVAGA